MKTKLDFLSPGKINEAYTLHALGANYKEIIEKTGVKNPFNTVRLVEKYGREFIKTGKIKHNGLNKTYLEVVPQLFAENILKKEDFKEEPEPENTLQGKEGSERVQKLKEEIKVAGVRDKKEDPFEKLQLVFDSFTKSLGEFVEAAVDIKAAQVYKELEEQKVVNLKLLENIDDAKNDNWVSNLKKKFQG